MQRKDKDVPETFSPGGKKLDPVARTKEYPGGKKGSLWDWQLKLFVFGSVFLVLVGLGIGYAEKEHKIFDSIMKRQVTMPDFVPMFIINFLNQYVPDELRAQRRPAPAQTGTSEGESEGMIDFPKRPTEWIREDKFEVWKRDFGNDMPDPDTWPGTIKLLWFAPIWSGGGYGSEAIAIAQSLNIEKPAAAGVREIQELQKRMGNKKNADLTPEEREEFLKELQEILDKKQDVEIPKEPEYHIYLRNFADQWNWVFVKSLPKDLFGYLMERTASHDFFLDVAPGEADARAGIPLPASLEMFREEHKQKATEREESGRSKEVVTKIVVCHSEPGAWSVPDSLYEAGGICPPSVPPGAPKGDHFYYIGRTMFETDRLPKNWEDRCNKLDEIWVPSAHHLEIFAAAGVERSKLHIVAEPVDTKFFTPKASPLNITALEKGRIGGREGTDVDGTDVFRFLSIFKWEERKGWNILARTFFTEFYKTDKTEVDDVALVILTNPFHLTRRQKREGESPFVFPLKEIAKEVLREKFAQEGRSGEEITAEDFQHLPPIIVLGYPIPMEQLPPLYKSANAFVLPSRGEGWGRPLQEAMSMGMVTIATNWSGNLAFQNTNNSLLIDVEEMEEIKEGAFRGHKWAKPSAESLARIMRDVKTDPKAFADLGKQARRDMRKLYSLDAFQPVLLKELKRIHNQNLEDVRKVRKEIAAASSSSSPASQPETRSQ